MCLKKIGLRAQNTILDSIVNKIGVDLYKNMMSMRIFILAMNKIFIWAPKNLQKMATASIWDLLTILY